VKCFKMLVAVVLVASFSSFAGIDLTIGGGLNISDVNLSKDYKLASDQTKSMLMGFNAGANARFAFNDKMGLVAGLNYETRGAKIKTSDLGFSETKTGNLAYLQIPVLFSYKFMPELAVNIGPEIGLLLRAKEKVEGDFDIDNGTFDVKSSTSSLDLGASIQVTYTISNMIVVGAGYDYGFINTDKNPGDMKGAMTNSNIKVTVAYLLHL
jgi:outer membrane immunogenic protein